MGTKLFHHFSLFFLFSLLIVWCTSCNLDHGLSGPYDVSGRVTKKGVGVSNVTISFSGGFSAVTTNPDGSWDKAGLSGAVTVTPALAGEEFNPPSIAVSTARSNVDFAALYWQAVGGTGVSSDEVSYLSMDLDSSGRPYVAFRDESVSGKVTVVRWNTSASSWEILGSAGFSAGQVMDISLALDGADTPYVAYTDIWNDWKATVMRWNGSSWAAVGSAGFTKDKAYYTSLALDSGGKPHVAFSAFWDLDRAALMRWTGTSWETVGGTTDQPGFSAGAAGYTRVALDSANTPYVAYMDVANGSKARVRKWYNTSWGLVGNEGFSEAAAPYISLALAAGATPYVAYKDEANSGKATVMRWDGTSWEAVGGAGLSDDAAEYVSLAIDGNSRPCVAYKDAANFSKATVMRWNGSSWEAVGGAGLSEGAAEYVTLAIDGSNRPYVAYKDVYNANKLTVMRFAP